MPTTRVVLRQNQRAGVEGVPQVLHTPSGTVLIDIQGTINVGDTPLIESELDLDPERDSKRPEGPVEIGKLEFSNEDVGLVVGLNQKLWGKIRKLPVPLAVLQLGEEVEVLDIITHKVLFNTRPQPVF